MPFLRERSGRWSSVKIVAFATTLFPALWVAYQAATDDLGPRPITEAIHQIGEWTLRLLLITLAITPAQRILNYPRLILARRTLGVACALYASLHISLYLLDQHFDLLKVASEIVLRIYLLIGAVALAGLITLAATSTDAAVSRLGPERWKSLHRLIYAIGLLATVHFFMQSKLNIYEPVLMAGSSPGCLAAASSSGAPASSRRSTSCFLPARRRRQPRRARRRSTCSRAGLTRVACCLPTSTSTWKCGRPGGCSPPAWPWLRWGSGATSPGGGREPTQSRRLP